MMITIQEYADKKGITRSAVYAAIKRGTLKAKEVNSGRERYLIDKKEELSGRDTPHIDGYKKISDHPLYTVWSGMKERCLNPNAHGYHNYGGRGIAVCDEWRNDSVAFIKWGMENGYKDGLQIDRKNNDGNYEPSNCRWVTPKVNCNNRRGNLSEEEKIRRKNEREEILRRKNERKEEKIRREKEYQEFVTSCALNKKNKKLSEQLLKEKQKAEKMFLKHLDNIDAYRQGFESLLLRKKYTNAIKFVDFDLLEKGVFDDLIERYMLEAYQEHYGIK